jgi:hypothetical protein
MSNHIKSGFKIISWQQNPYDEPKEGSKLFRADVKKIFQVTSKQRAQPYFLCARARTTRVAM